MSTHTSVPFWLGMSLVRLDEWFETAAEIHREDMRTT